MFDKGERHTASRSCDQANTFECFKDRLAFREAFRTATSLGSDTAGSFSMYFDGSAASLEGSGEDVDAAHVAPDGRILLSTTRGFRIPGLSGHKKDILELRPDGSVQRIRLKPGGNSLPRNVVGLCVSD